MELIKHNLNINFVGKFKLFFSISIACIIVSIIGFFILGLNYGVDFKGGTEMQLKIDGTNIAGVRSALSSYGSVEIQEFEGKGNEFVINLPTISIAKKEEVDAYIEDVKNNFSSSANLIKKHFDVEVGDRIELWFDKPIEKEKLAGFVQKHNLPITGEIDYNQIGERHIYKIMLVSFTKKVVDTIDQKIGSKAEIQRVELVGPKVGKKLRTDTFLAIFYSLIALLLYIALRFNYQSAPGAIFATFHDVMILLGVFVFSRLTFDLTIVAAFLTVVGYSLKDTVVVYDRIRENHNNPKKGKTLMEKINTSVNETLSRTIITSVLTFLVVSTLLVLGGDIIWGFAFTMCLGIVVGTYSSIYIAAPITDYIEEYMKRKNVV